MLQEYSGILSKAGADLGPDHRHLQGNKFYQNHLKALELQKQEEELENKDLKLKIMA